MQRSLCTCMHIRELEVAVNNAIQDKATEVRSLLAIESRGLANTSIANKNKTFPWRLQDIFRPQHMLHRAESP